ncbi:FAD-binding oxidoreductase [Haloarcula salinisoli]|uniref:Oxidoreductase n=1 Tax=Haloarcula salinisoli TaxID=2487746 RepID=A0A8J7YM34_9EURY|nr:FAD-binding oxidoreductase [Halomicroarcula salinisoli]MBX0305299.1 oxidoreductase [Halomicroarcula salinisoli]
MRIRRHLSQHETAEELPLVTESAVVTDVSAMDRNRTDEVLTELRATLDEHGTDAWRRDRPTTDEACEDWLRSQLDEVDHLDGGTPLTRYVSEDDQTGSVGEKLTALQERYLQPYPSLLRITVETDDPVEFAAGQYLSLRYQDTTRVYSIASSPTRDELEFCVGRVPGGQMTSELAVDLEAGDTVTLRGPYGELLLEEPSPRDIVFLATGTGAAPLKSMIDYLFDTGRDRYEDTVRDIWLVLGGGWKDTLPYRVAFQSYADERDNFHFVPTVSRESYLTEWTGETAYVQHTLAKYLEDGVGDGQSLPPEFEHHRNTPPRYPIDARLDPSQLEVYACGLNAMVSSLVEAAEQLGVPPEHTQFEGFG